jgi:hypothetical protein
LERRLKEAMCASASGVSRTWKLDRPSCHDLYATLGSRAKNRHTETGAWPVAADPALPRVLPQRFPRIVCWLRMPAKWSGRAFTKDSLDPHGV